MPYASRCVEDGLEKSEGGHCFGDLLTIFQSCPSAIAGFLPGIAFLLTLSRESHLAPHIIPRIEGRSEFVWEINVKDEKSVT